LSYPVWLLGLSLLFVILERIAPRRRFWLGRPLFVSDVFYLVFNSEILGVLLGVLSINMLQYVPRASWGLVSSWRLWAQLPVLLLVMDFTQWLIHNSLHRIPWLWKFHKVHHSIEDLDWIGNWRFHWFEGVFYRAILYVPAALFGFSGAAMFWYGVFATLVAHFAHANLRLHIGPLKYVLNSPEMHVWHHTHPDSGPFNRNFGLTLSVWDWLFGTAYCPGYDPARLGFEGIESFPRAFWRQTLIPFLRVSGARGRL
jgi:sterol desaturase/sphingolipid hydroxylase (fatty acid hydroxylase superfamily)